MTIIYKKNELVSKLEKYKDNSPFFQAIHALFDESKSHQFFLDKSDILFIQKIICLKDLNNLKADFDKLLEFNEKNRFQPISHKKIKNYLQLKLSTSLIETIQIFLQKQINTLTFQNLKKTSNSKTEKIINNHTTFLEFINSCVDNMQFNEVEADILIQYLENLNITEETEEIALLSYVSHYHLSILFFLLSKYLLSISPNEKISLKNKGINKYNYFYSYYKKIFQLFYNKYSDLFINAYKYMGYLNLNIILDKQLLNLIKKKLKEISNHNIGEDQINSHYIQGAYLEKILGSSIQNTHTKDSFRVKDTHYNNLFCRPYFYGDTSHFDSVEKQLSNIENNFLNYTDNLKNRTYEKISIQDKIFFLINFIRQPIFLDSIIQNYTIHFNESFDKSVDNYCPFSDNSYQISHAIVYSTNFHQNLLFAKSIQMFFLKFYLALIVNNNFYSFSIEQLMPSFEEYLKKNETQDFLTTDSNQKFLYNIIVSISNFITNDYLILRKKICISEVSNTLFFINKNKNTLFTNANSFEFIFFPITHDELVIFEKIVTKNQKIKRYFIKPHFFNYLNDNIFINYNDNNPFFLRTKNK